MAYEKLKIQYVTILKLVAKYSISIIFKYN